jgi:hypothetical protein
MILTALCMQIHYLGKWEGVGPFPLALVRDMHASKTLCTELYKSWVYRWFYAQEPRGYWSFLEI